MKHPPVFLPGDLFFRVPKFFWADPQNFGSCHRRTTKTAFIYVSFGKAPVLCDRAKPSMLEGQCCPGDFALTFALDDFVSKPEKEL